MALAAVSAYYRQMSSKFLDECRADMDRMLETLRMIDDEMLHTGFQKLGQQAVDTTASYRASVQTSVDELAILIKILEADDLA